MIKVIIFDVMGVIFKVGDDTQKLLIPYIRSLKPDVAPDFIKKQYIAASLGEISADDFWLSAGFSKDEAASVEKDYLDSCLELDGGFIECASVLKKKYDLALLSNDVSRWNAYLRKKHGIDGLIRRAFISGDMHLRKPDKRIFSAALSQLGVKACECVFIDDDPQRVDAAASLGIMVILFNREGADYRGIAVKDFSSLTALLA